MTESTLNLVRIRHDHFGFRDNWSVWGRPFICDSGLRRRVSLPRGCSKIVFHTALQCAGSIPAQAPSSDLHSACLKEDRLYAYIDGSKQPTNLCPNMYNWLQVKYQQRHFWWWVEVPEGEAEHG